MCQTKGPTFYFQLGWQDQLRCLKMLRKGQGDGAIFSPRHLKRQANLRTYMDTYLDCGAEVLVDPQCYDLRYPHSPEYPLNADRLDARGWQNQNTCAEFIETILEWQAGLHVTKLLLPCSFPRTGMSDAWLGRLHRFAESAREWANRDQSSQPIIATLALPAAVVSSEEDRASLLDDVVGLEVDGFYLVIESDLFPRDPDFVSGLLDLIFRLKQNLYFVILGYSSYVSMLAFPLGLDGFASGGFDRMRAFSARHFAPPQPGVQRPPRARFWSLRLLSRVIFPDEAELLYDRGIWAELNDGSPYAALLFQRRPPTEIDAAGLWGRTESFKHYLWTCVAIARRFQSLSLTERVATVREMCTTAQRLSRLIEDRGVLLRDGQASYLSSWLSGFDAYMDTVQDELSEESGWTSY